MADKVNLTEKFAAFEEVYVPKIVGELNGQYVKVAKFLGAYPWHFHEGEDELFWVVRGSIRLCFRDREVELGAGEFCIVPKGVEHRPVADEVADVVLFEPASTLNTGNVRTALTREKLDWI